MDISRRPKEGARAKFRLRLAALLKDNRHLRGPRVLHRDDGTKVHRAVLWYWMGKAQKRANLKVTGGLHILRHTFCARLAMLGAPTMAIKELAGHEDISTTQRYMHLTPATKNAAIRLLEKGALFGDVVETGVGEISK